MDAKGARLLRARIAAGGAPGQRVEIVAVEGDHRMLRLGARGTVRSFEEAGIRVEFDSGETLLVDPLSVQLRRIRRPR
jgi:hypothetical protein